jgi:hypothetical protein
LPRELTANSRQTRRLPNHTRHTPDDESAVDLLLTMVFAMAVGQPRGLRRIDPADLAG